MFSRIFSKLASFIGDANLRVLRGVALVLVFLVLGKLAGLGREVIIAYKHGVSATVDIYVFIFILVTWLPTVFQGVSQSVLVPTLRRLDQQSRSEFLSQLVSITLLASLLIAILFWIAANNFLGIIFTSFTPSVVDQAVVFLIQVLPAIVFLFLIPIYGAELLAQEKHANTLAEGIPALVVLACVWFWPAERPTLEPFSAGIVIGYGLQLWILAHLSQLTIDLSKSIFSFRHKAWKEVASALGILAVGSIAMSFSRPIDQFFAAGLGTGGVSELSYSTRLLALGLGLGTTIMTRALLPVLSDKNLNFQERYKMVAQWAWLVAIVGIIVVMLGWLLSPWAVKTIFERGAFTADSTDAVATLVRFGLLQIPFLMIGVTVIQIFASSGRYGVIAFSSFVGIAMKLIVIFPFVRLFGINGIPLSTAAMYGATLVYFIIQLRKLKVD